MTSSNPLLRQASVMFERAGKQGKAPIWGRASELLSGPSSSRVEVNVGHLSRVAQDGEAVFVPGKVLGWGLMQKKLVVGAFTFSESAKAKIAAKGGKTMTVSQFLKKYPKGSGVRLVA